MRRDKHCWSEMLKLRPGAPLPGRNCPGGHTQDLRRMISHQEGRLSRTVTAIVAFRFPNKSYAYGNRGMIQCWPKQQGQRSNRGDNDYTCKQNEAFLWHGRMVSAILFVCSWPVPQNLSYRGLLYSCVTLTLGFAPSASKDTVASMSAFPQPCWACQAHCP
jgi:hypothetical protein